MTLAIARGLPAPDSDNAEATPAAHRLQKVAVDRLGSLLSTEQAGSLILVYGPTGEDCDAATLIGANMFAYGHRLEMLRDPSFSPVVPVLATFDRKGVLDLRTLFAEIQGKLGAARSDVQVPSSELRSVSAGWVLGRRAQLKECADQLIAAASECEHRKVKVVVVTRFERRGRRIPVAVPGDGAEMLAQFAAAAGVILVLSGGFEVLEYRTTSTAVAEVYLPRYQSTRGHKDRLEFARIAALELAVMGAKAPAASDDVLSFLMAYSVGSVARLHRWIASANRLLAERPAKYTAEDVLGERVPLQPHQLRSLAHRFVAFEKRIAEEASVTIDDVIAILEGTAPSTVQEDIAPPRPTVNYDDPRTLRPGERGLEDDPVGEAEPDDV